MEQSVERSKYNDNADRLCASRWAPRLSTSNYPSDQNVRNSETEHVYSRPKIFPFPRAMAPEYIPDVIRIMDKRVYDRESNYACEDCLARSQYLIPLWLFHHGSWTIFART